MILNITLCTVILILSILIFIILKIINEEYNNEIENILYRTEVKLRNCYNIDWLNEIKTTLKIEIKKITENKKYKKLIIFKKNQLKFDYILAIIEARINKLKKKKINDRNKIQKSYRRS